MAKRTNKKQGSEVQGTKGLDMKALVAEVASEVQAPEVIEVVEVTTPVIEVREGFEVVDGVVQMLPQGPNPGVDEIMANDQVTEVIEEPAQEVVVDPRAAQIAKLKELAQGTEYEGLVNDIDTYLAEHAAIKASAPEIMENEKDPNKLRTLLITRSENLKAVGTRIRERFSDLTQDCIGVTGSIADKAVQKRKDIYKAKAEAPKEEAQAATK